MKNHSGVGAIRGFGYIIIPCDILEIYADIHPRDAGPGHSTIHDV